MKRQVKKLSGYLSCPGRGTAPAHISTCARVHSAGCTRSKAPSGDSPGVFFPLRRPARGGQNLRSVRPNPHASASLPTGLASEETVDWLGWVGDDRAELHVGIMAYKLTFLF